MTKPERALIPGSADFPRNQWYVGAFGHEITQEPLHRMLFGDPVVFWRTDSGDVTALFDICPHRGMRLSNGGKIIDDTIQCGYHGIRFNSKGRGCFIPSGGVATAALSVRRYPTKEISGWVWVWAGEADQADEALIPDHDELGLTAGNFFAYFGLRLDAASNYLYSFENLVDATHITYLHHGLIDTGNVAAQPFTVESDGVRVTMLRKFANEEIAPMTRRGMELRGARANRVIDLTSYAPNLCMVRQVFTDADFPDDAPRDRRLLFGITPSGPKSCYQFVAIAQNYENNYAAKFEDLRTLLMEDVVALDEIQRMFDLIGPDKAREVSVKSDVGAILSRRIIAAQLRKEELDASSIESALATGEGL